MGEIKNYLDYNGLQYLWNKIVSKLSRKVDDVQVNGASVTNDGVANIPVASNDTLGVVKIPAYGAKGIDINNDNELRTRAASSSIIKFGDNSYMPIVPYSQHESTFYGLAKASGDTTQSQSSNTVGTYTNEAKASIKTMLGVEDPTVDDVQVNGVSIVNNGIAEIPLATSSIPGVTKSFVYGVDPANDGGIFLINGQLYVVGTSTNKIKLGSDLTSPVTAGNQRQATFYGLAKAAGDTTQSVSDNAVGTYTDEAKTAIKTMLGVTDPVVDDVQVNGTSVVQNGVANIPEAANATFGVIKYYTNGSEGIAKSPSRGRIVINKASSTQIKAGTEQYRPVVPSNEHESTFYGLAKAAGADEKDSTLALGTYTDFAKGAIQKMLGIDSLLGTDESNLTASRAYAVGDVFIANGKMYEVTTAIAADGAIITEGTGQNVTEITVADNFVKKDDFATGLTPGVVKISSGLYITQAGDLKTNRATNANVKTGTNDYLPIVPSTQHVATFYGLAKAAGDATQSTSNNAVGTYTDDAKTSIRTMLGAVGTEDYANSTDAGVVKISDLTTSNFGIAINANGYLYALQSSDSQIKAGVNFYRPIMPEKQHLSVFYGLAKAAGDTTQSASSNAVGTYTPEAQAAIKQMLGVSDLSTDITVSGTTPTITASANTRYLCGEVTSLNFTPSATGICEVIFTSGSAVTLLTLPATVKMPEWFDATALETDTIYDISIVDGVYGAVMTWQV